MTIATVVKAWKDSTRAFLVARVDEGEEGEAAIEYIGTTLLVDADGEAKTTSVLKSECIADIKAQRNAQIAVPSAVSMTGTITL